MNIPPETLVGQLSDISEAQANKLARHLTDEYMGVIVFSLRRDRYFENTFTLEARSEKFDRPEIMKLLPEIRMIVEDYIREL